MEAEKSHDLLYASWRTRKDGDIIPSKASDLRTRGTDDITLSFRPNAKEPEVTTSPSPRVWRFENQELWCSSLWKNEHPSSRRESMSPSSALLFYLGPRGTGWCLPTLVKADLFTQSIESNANLFQKYPHRHSQWVSFTSYPGIPQPIKMTHKTNHYGH